MGSIINSLLAISEDPTAVAAVLDETSYAPVCSGLSDSVLNSSGS